ncbi:hypothetical protein BAE44_0002320, partial [Dichanthelium oligosanthes]
LDPHLPNLRINSQPNSNPMQDKGKSSSAAAAASEQPPEAEGRPRRRSTPCPARSSVLRRRESLSGYSESLSK